MDLRKDDSKESFALPIAHRPVPSTWCTREHQLNGVNVVAIAQSTLPQNLLFLQLNYYKIPLHLYLERMLLQTLSGLSLSLNSGSSVRLLQICGYQAIWTIRLSTHAFRDSKRIAKVSAVCDRFSTLIQFCVCQARQNFHCLLENRGLCISLNPVIGTAAIIHHDCKPREVHA